MIYPIFGAAETVIEIQASAHDVTELRKTEESLRNTHHLLNALACRLVNAEEEERRRIARELHDDFNQKLAAHAIGLSNLTRDFDSGEVSVREKLEKLGSDAVSLSDDIRLIAHELHSVQLRVAGFEKPCDLSAVSSAP